VQALTAILTTAKFLDVFDHILQQFKVSVVCNTLIMGVLGGGVLVQPPK